MKSFLSGENFWVNVQYFSKAQKYFGRSFISSWTQDFIFFYSEIFFNVFQKKYIYTRENGFYNSHFFLAKVNGYLMLRKNFNFG
jgi:hypothetical protein